MGESVGKVNSQMQKAAMGDRVITKRDQNPALYLNTGWWLGSETLQLAS